MKFVRVSAIGFLLFTSVVTLAADYVAPTVMPSNFAITQASLPRERFHSARTNLAVTASRAYSTPADHPFCWPSEPPC